MEHPESTVMLESCEKTSDKNGLFESVDEEECNKYDYVRMTWSDLHGIARCKTTPARHIQGLLKDGVHLWNGLNALSARDVITSELLETAGAKNMDVRAIPGAKIHHLPWACGGDPAFKVGQILCESYWQATNIKHATCTRSLARQQLDRLYDLTGLRLYSTFEVEFMLYDKQSQKRLGDCHPAFCHSVEFSQYEKMIYGMERQMFIGGVDIEALQHEYSAGQYEFNIHPQYGIAAGDQMFLCKQYIKEIAVQQGLIATFIAKVDDNVGNGLHFNSSLWKGEENALYDSKSPAELTELGKHWLAGLIKHTAALTALCNPTINCYRRLGTIIAPSKANWGYLNKAACVCVITEGSHRTYFENRLPSGSANPYLILAGTLAAGLDGLINKLPCPPEMNTEANKFPSSLPEAMEALKDDTVIREALGEDFMTWWLMTKNSNDIKHIQSIKDDDKRFAREMEEYRDIL